MTRLHPIPRPGYWPPDTLCLADAVEFVSFATKDADPRLRLRRALAGGLLVGELCSDGKGCHPIPADYWEGGDADGAFLRQYPFVPILVMEPFGPTRRRFRQVRRREFGAVVFKKSEIGKVFGADVDAWSPRGGARPPGSDLKAINVAAPANVHRSPVEQWRDARPLWDEAAKQLPLGATISVEMLLDFAQARLLYRPARTQAERWLKDNKLYKCASGYKPTAILK